MRLEGTRALVTGASSGIGATTARLLAAEGAEVALLARDRAALDRVARTIEGGGGRAHVLVADVADRALLERQVEAAATRMGGLDAAVVNAAAAGFGRFEEIAPEDFDRTVAVSLMGAIDTVRAVLPHLRRSGGALVVTGSIVATVPTPLFSPYVTAKSGLRGFVRTLRSELRDERSPASISLVQPGVVRTPFWESVTSATGRAARRPPGGYSPEPIARTIVDSVVRPRAEVTVGGAALAQLAAYAGARPLMDFVTPLTAKWLLRSRRPAARPGSLWGPPAAMRPEGGGRLSLLETARRAMRLIR